MGRTVGRVEVDVVVMEPMLVAARGDGVPDDP
jgi:hypothetical protein